jgi:hypothetical protein
MEGAGLAPAFLLGPVHFTRPRRGHRNKPLMACSGHWKSARVLPMFRAHPLASDPQAPAVRA